MIKEFKPANKKQADFIFSTKKFIMMSGAVSAGKTYLGCMKGFMLNMKYPGNRGLICRKEGASLRNSTMVTLLQQVIPPEIIINFNQTTGVLVHRTPDPNKNSTIVFSGLDKKADNTYPTKIGSTEYGWIFVDEGIELNKGDWDVLMARLRYRIVGLNDQQNRLLPRQLFTGTNPDGPKHHLYNFFFKKVNDNKEVFFMTPYDNPYNTPEYLQTLEAELEGVTRDRLLLGKWVQAEGIIYNDFDSEKHVKPISDFIKVSDYKSIIGGADSNYPKPRAGLIIGVRGDGRRDVLEEFYVSGAEVEEIIAWFNDWCQNNNRHITVYHDPSDPQSIDKFNKSSWINCVKAQNAVEPGIGVVAAKFSKNLLFIADHCVNLISELQSYRWKSGVGSKQVPLKEDDHLCDSLRYSLYSEVPVRGFAIGRTF